MKSQKHNQGELKALTVNLEKNVVESFEKMSQNSKVSVDDLVVIALKRFMASHGDYLGTAPSTDDL